MPRQLKDYQEYPAPKQAALWAHLEDRYGIPPAVWQGYRLVLQNRKTLHLWGPEALPELAPGADTWGLPFVNIKGRVPKLTTSACAAFGHLGSRHVVTLDEADFAKYLGGETLPLPLPSVAADWQQGYVIIKFAAYTPGMAFLRHTEAGWLLASCYPKGRGQQALTAMATLPDA